MTTINTFDQQFTDISRNIVANGRHKEERNGVRVSLFGQTLRSDLSEGLPIHTQKKTNWKAALKEWIGMINGGTNAKDLGEKIWSQWGLSEDDIRLSPVGREEVLIAVADKFLADDYTEVATAAIEDLEVNVDHFDTFTGEYGTHTEELDAENLPSVEDLASSIRRHYAAELMSKWVREFPNLTDEQRSDPYVVLVIIAANLADAGDEASTYVEFISNEPDMNKRVQYVHDTFPDTVISSHVVMEKGYLGMVYGAVWSGLHDGVDQIAQLEDAIKSGGHARMVIDGWVPSLLPDSALSHDDNIKAGKQVLPPCHVTYVFDLFEGTLNLEMLQRSGDWWIGVPFNHLHLAYWVESLAYVHGLTVGEIKHDVTNAHVYANQLEAFDYEEYMNRPHHPKPKLIIDAPDAKSIRDLKPEHFTVEGYEHGDFIDIPVSS